MVEDEIIFANKIKNKYSKPHFIIGQSMGSFICQRMIQKRKELAKGYIMLGSTCCLEKIAKVGKVVAKILMTFFGVKVSNIMDKLVFWGYNKKTEKRTSFDWLNRNHKEIDKYINDSFCGFISPNRFYYYLLDALTKLWQPKNMEKVSQNENILILSGDADPLSNYGKGVENLYALYLKYGIKNVEFKLYPDSRHELLNEENKLEEKI
jgi:alpha-beta hydrolase superfamily lysophospholipase